MTPTDELKQEHQTILRVLNAAEREVTRIIQTYRADIRKIVAILDFFKNFNDRFHNAKEEGLLFERIVSRGMPADEGPIAVMLQEHGEGRRRLKVVADVLPRVKGGDRGALALLKDNLESYARLLRMHMLKEDRVLYPRADALLSSRDKRELAAAFEEIESREMGEGAHVNYHELAYSLAPA